MAAIAVSAGRPTLIRVATVGAIVGRLTGRRIGVLAVREGPPHFEPLAALCVAGQVGIHIDRTFALEEVPEALRPALLRPRQDSGADHDVEIGCVQPSADDPVRRSSLDHRRDENIRVEDDSHWRSSV